MKQVIDTEICTRCGGSTWITGAANIRRCAPTIRVNNSGQVTDVLCRKCETEECMDAIMGKGKFERKTAQLDAQACDHQWTDARNEVIASGEMCLKCGAVRAGNRKAQGNGEGSE